MFVTVNEDEYQTHVLYGCLKDFFLFFNINDN